LATDPFPDYTAALAWIVELSRAEDLPKYLRQFVMTMLGRGHYAQLCSLAFNRKELDIVEHTLEDVSRSTIVESSDQAPFQRIFGCISFLLRLLSLSLFLIKKYVQFRKMI